MNGEGISPTDLQGFMIRAVFGKRADQIVAPPFQPSVDHLGCDRTIRMVHPHPTLELSGPWPYFGFLRSE